MLATLLLAAVQVACAVGRATHEDAQANDSNENIAFSDAHPGAICGNGVLEADEICDDGNTSSCDGCTADCGAIESRQTFYRDLDNDGAGKPDDTVMAYCAGAGRSSSDDDCDDENGAVHPGATEICGDGLDNDCSGGDAPCPGCGNGSIEAGEECEAPFSVCCNSSTCRYLSAGNVCRPAAGPCDVAESCSGSSAGCPGNVFVSAGAPCTDTSPDDCNDARCDGNGGCVQDFTTESDGYSCAGGGTCLGGSCIVAGDYEVLRTCGAHIVDGDLSEFANAPSVSVHTMNVRALWDDTAIYLAYDVSDQQVMAIITERDIEDIWMDDGVEFFIDTLNDGGGTMLIDDYQLIINAINTNYDAQLMDGAVWDGNWTSVAVISGTYNNNSDTDSGFKVEVALPWSEIGGKPAPGTVVGMSFAQNDMDASGDYHEQWGGYNLNFRTPSQWKDVVLSGTKVPGCGIN